MKRLLILIGVAALAWYGWPVSAPALHDPPPMIDLLPADPRAAPLQRDLAHGPRFTVNGLEARALTQYAISGRVLASARYRLGRAAALAPFDLAIGWGRMTDSAVIDRLDIHQGGRWYFWRYEGQPPLPPREIETSSANVHLIPANDAVARALRRASAGQTVALRGYLVELHATDGWQWRSSLSREDTGAGSCELMYVHSVERL